MYLQAVTGCLQGYRGTGKLSPQPVTRWHEVSKANVCRLGCDISLDCTDSLESPGSSSQYPFGEQRSAVRQLAKTSPCSRLIHTPSAEANREAWLDWLEAVAEYWCGPSR